MSIDPRTLDALDRTLRLCQGVIFMPGVATDEEVATALISTRVAIVADATNLASAACQSAIVAFARLVLGYGCSLRLVMPEALVCGYQPPLRGSEFRTALVDLARDVILGSDAECATETTAGDLVFVFGTSRWSGRSAEAWRVAADDWSGWTCGVDSPGVSFPETFPVGALAAAAIASTEPFKAAARRLGASLRVPEQVAPVRSARVSLGAPFLRPREVPLNEIYCVSAGAIINAFTFTLLRIPSVFATLQLFEPEDGEPSNLNRYVLMRRSSSRLPKVQLLSEWQSATVRLHGHRLRITAEMAGQLAGRNVVVGVDHVPTRWVVQRHKPAWLAVGATDDLFVQASEHIEGGACAGCAYFAAAEGQGQPIPTASFVSFWAGLLLGARLVRHALAHPFERAEQMTELSPLLLNSPVSFRTYEVPRRRDCPVGCRASGR